MNISKTIKIWTVGLLAGMVAVSCGDSSGYIPPQYSSSSCTDISHYDYWAGDCMGQVVLQQEEQVLDTLTECAATFGNYTNRTFAVKNFPIRFNHVARRMLGNGYKLQHAQSLTKRKFWGCIKIGTAPNLFLISQ